MREWNLRQGDPLLLTMAADHRLCKPDPGNDHIWEMELGGGDPPALAVRTTYGLRARSMRIFPRFVINGKVYCNPPDFHTPPSLRFFTPNFMRVDFFPGSELKVQAETWVPDPHTLAGRFTISNQAAGLCMLQVELCGHLLPMQGESMRNVLLHSSQVLSGRTVDLAPVIFLTGGPTPAESSVPGLALRLSLEAGGVRSLTWVQAALGSQEESFEHARQIAACPWDAEIARLELVNEASIVDVRCGDPDWDAVFAFSQKQAHSLCIPGLDDRTGSSLLVSRQPDQSRPSQLPGKPGFLTANPSDLDCYYLGNVLAGSPEMAVDLVRRQLSRVVEEGEQDPNQHGKDGVNSLPLPLLAGMAWDACQRIPASNILLELFPTLIKFLERWLDAKHDLDGDGLPEGDFYPWEYLAEDPLQGGRQKSQAYLDGSCVETPALGAMLYHEIQALVKMAAVLGLEEQRSRLMQKEKQLGEAVEACWDNRAGWYQRRDCLTHQSPAGSDLGSLRGSGQLDVGMTFTNPTRLVIGLNQLPEPGRSWAIWLNGRNNRVRVEERISRGDFRWSRGSWQSTGCQLFTAIESMKVEGLGDKNQVVLRVMDFNRKDISQLLPLWAGIPEISRVEKMLSSQLEKGKRFWGMFGIPNEPRNANKGTSRSVMYLPLNAMLVEGLDGYGKHEEAVHLLGGLMGAVVSNLKQNKAFMQYFDAQDGSGSGEHNTVQGLAPLGTFLKLLGVEFCPPSSVKIRGLNPFPWQVTVQYKGITVTRLMDRTEITFPSGQNIILSDPTEAVVEAE